MISYRYYWTQYARAQVETTHIGQQARMHYGLSNYTLASSTVANYQQHLILFGTTEGKIQS